MSTSLRLVRLPWLAAFAWLQLPGAAAAPADLTRLAASPDGTIRVSIRLPTPNSNQPPLWSAEFLGKPILADCQLGLQTAEAGDVLAGARVVAETNRTVDRFIPVLFGKSSRARDRFHESRFTFESKNRRRADVVFRCYNDAIAVRYELPKDSENGSLTVLDESTSFQLQRDPTAYAQHLEHHRTSHEHPVVRAPYRDLPPNVLFDLPLAFAWSDGSYAAITEASLRHYAGMALMRSAPNTAAPRLVCKLTPRPDGAKVVRPLPMRTPWRVVLIGDRPGALLESNTLYCLNDPSILQDTSWIKPGKITFSWWNGDVFDGRPGAPILSFETAKQYIDFCARHDLPTHAMTSTDPPTAPWYRQSNRGVEPGPDTDVTRPRADFDLQTIRRYAASKGVRLWTWVHQGALRGRVEEAFAAFESMGWSGMMVDFFDHDDQETVEFAETVLEAAARHRILIQLHGIWKPTGLERTYPNLVNHEGALNLEYLKWSDRCTPEHNLMMAFTRLIAGPMDYHSGGFRAVTRDKFEPRNVAPNVLGTRGHHLAMYVCFDNPNPMLADYPTAYEGQPGFDFLKLVPTWWDETRVLVGDVGATLVTARRAGRVWYVGGMAAGPARDLELPLTFLGDGNFSARIWRDAPEADTDPNRLATETMTVKAGEALRVRFANDGGFAMQLTPATP